MFSVDRLVNAVAEWRLIVGAALLVCFLSCHSVAAANDDLTPEELQLIKTVEAHRIKAINKVIGSVVAIYDKGRQGGGSGVIIHPSGIALTNHHVIMGSGVEGFGGLADGNLYPWKLIGTDPGGDVSIIQLEGKDEFPFSPLGDSDKVRVGDWALAMGNPFVLTEDQVPTVTLGIVSGVKRYQPGAGLNQLEYGNCIQVDSSINPGNSGGPLFNLAGEVIGINGRGSFKERGRVNVGLGYAISSNQIKNFIPDLLATKLVEHATLDAVFSEREGKVVCTTINLDSKVAELGLELGDELLQFEETIIENANQFTNLICTIPEDWPIKLVIRKKDKTEKTIYSRAFGLPYQKPKMPKNQPKGKNKQEEQQLKRQREMIKLLAADPGTVRFKDLNRTYADQIVETWKKDSGNAKFDSTEVVKIKDIVFRGDDKAGEQTLWLATDGRFKLEWSIDGESPETFVYDGDHFYQVGDEVKRLTLVEAKLNLPIVSAIGTLAHVHENPLGVFGSALIHGSDKALDSVACRLEYLDEDSDSLFAWIQMYGAEDDTSHVLLKVSADTDCDEDGGVVFEDWQSSGKTVLPMRRRFVNGLAETTTLELEVESAKWLDSVDEEMFRVAADGETAENSDSTNEGEQEK